MDENAIFFWLHSIFSMDEKAYSFLYSILAWMRKHLLFLHSIVNMDEKTPHFFALNMQHG